MLLLFRDGGQQCSLSWCLCGCCQEDALWHIWRLPQRPQSNRSLSKSSGITIKSISFCNCCMCMCAILAHCQYVIDLGFLDSLTPQVIASNAAIKESGLSPEHINSVCIGNVLSASAPDAPYLSRHVALKCGLPVPTPALIGT